MEFPFSTLIAKKNPLGMSPGDRIQQRFNGDPSGIALLLPRPHHQPGLFLSDGQI